MSPSTSGTNNAFPTKISVWVVNNNNDRRRFLLSQIDKIGSPYTKVAVRCESLAQAAAQSSYCQLEEMAVVIISADSLIQSEAVTTLHDKGVAIVIYVETTEDEERLSGICPAAALIGLNASVLEIKEAIDNARANNPYSAEKETDCGLFTIMAPVSRPRCIRSNCPTAELATVAPQAYELLRILEERRDRFTRRDELDRLLVDRCRRLGLKCNPETKHQEINRDRIKGLINKLNTLFSKQLNLGSNVISCRGDSYALLIRERFIKSVAPQVLVPAESTMIGPCSFFENWTATNRPAIERNINRFIDWANAAIRPIGSGGGGLYYFERSASEIVDLSAAFVEIANAERKTRHCNALTIGKLAAYADSLTTLLRFTAGRNHGLSAVAPFEPALVQTMNTAIEILSKEDLRWRFAEDKAERREIISPQRALDVYDVNLYSIKTGMDFYRFRSTRGKHTIGDYVKVILSKYINRNKAINNAVLAMWSLGVTGQYDKVVEVGGSVKLTLDDMARIPELLAKHEVSLINFRDDCDRDYSSSLANIERTLASAEVIRASQAGSSDRRRCILESHQYLDSADALYHAADQVWLHGLANLTLCRAALAVVEEDYGNARILFHKAARGFRETSDYFKQNLIDKIIENGVENIQEDELRALLFLE